MGEKRVLVTGASRGIGRSIALRLAEDGWNVAIHYGSRLQEAEACAGLLKARLVGMYQADLANPEEAPGLFERAAADGPVDAIVNNAGIYRQGSFLQLDNDSFSADYRAIFAVNFESPMLLMRSSGRYFAGRGGGKILNVASRVGFKSEAMASFYAASKAALINMTRSLAVELAPQNIGVFGIAPGWVDTAMVRDGMEDRLPSILESIPLGRMASPEDCASAAAFLLSDDASYLSGQILDINGASYFH